MEQEREIDFEALLSPKLRLCAKSKFRKQEAGGAKRNSLPVIHPRFRFESTEPRLAGRLDAEARLLIKIWRSARQSQPLWLYESSCNNNR